MRQVFASVLIGLAAVSCTFGQSGDDTNKQPSPPPKITAEFLLEHGFKRLPKYPDFYEREHVRVTEASRDLGFSLKSLKFTVNPFSDTRVGEIGEAFLIVELEQAKDGPIVHDSLEDPDAICTVRVSLSPGPAKPAREFLKTDSAPHLRILSVKAPKGRPKYLRVEFELSATGTRPVAIQQNDFHVRLAGGDIPPGWYFGSSFPTGTPRIVVVSPDKPQVFTLGVRPVDQEGRFSKGEYSARVDVYQSKGLKPQRYDYEWEGERHHSDAFKFVVE